MTGQNLLELSYDLLGMRLNDGGITGTAGDLTARAVSLINILLAENAYLDSMIKKEKTPPVYLVTLEDKIEISGPVCAGAMPFGLAAMLINSEDQDTAAFMQNMYICALQDIRRSLPGIPHQIKNIY